MNVVTKVQVFIHIDEYMPEVSCIKVFESIVEANEFMEEYIKNNKLGEEYVKRCVLIKEFNIE